MPLCALIRADQAGFLEISLQKDLSTHVEDEIQERVELRTNVQMSDLV
jgi:hypothetical protein